MLLYTLFFPFSRAIVVVSLYRQKQELFTQLKMASLEVVEETLVNLYNMHKENYSAMGNISQYVKSLGLSTISPNFDSGLNNTNYQNTNSSQKNRFVSKSQVSDKKQMASAEVVAHAFGVLAYLKSERTKYVNLDKIPCIQNTEWNQICDLAKYLLNKKFVTIKGIETKLFAQITPLGLQFLHACEATAC